MKKCPCCNSSKYYPIFNFGSQPWCGDFRSVNSNNKIKKHPLNLIMCKSCRLVRLNYFIPKKIMFEKTTYLTGSSDELLIHFKKVAEKIKSKFKITNNSKILDIGSNDGSFLKNFKSSYVLGVESAKNLCKISTKAGVKTKNGYFNYLLSKKINKKFDIIHGSGVMFHLEEINSAFKGIKFLLKENGVLVIEFLYLKTIVDKYYFDQIYHEHLFYYNIQTLNNFLNKYKLEIFDYDYATIHGGQIVAYICHKGTRKISVKLRNAIKLEINQKANSPHYFKKFRAVLKKSKNIPAKYLNKLKNQSKFIVGLGAPAKGNTLMNYYNINNYQVDLLLEKNFLRKNKISPGSNIPIMMEDDLNIKPDIILVLIWNLKKDIKFKIRKKFNGSKFIFPKSFLRI